MKHIPIARMAVAATLLSATAFNAAAQQDNSAVLQRLAALEARVAALEGPSSNGMQGAAEAWQDPEKWKRLRKGMTEQEVRDLLGKPTTGNRNNQAASQTLTIMAYANGLQIGQVNLLNGHVSSWNEPLF